MNFGIVGTGMIAGIHARAIASMAGGSLRSVYNHRPAGAVKFAAEHGVRAVSDFSEFLADPGLDVVTICTPSGAHLEPALATLAAGKHVVVEKPLEVTTARIDRMIAAADGSGKSLASVLNCRFTPAVDAFKAAVAAGRFGTLTSASCYVKWFRSQAYYDSAPWRGTVALDGGGVLMNQGIHTIDLLLHLAGPVRSVQANTACLAHDGIEVEDSAVAIVEFRNGGRGVIEGSTCAWSADGHPARVQLAGTGGSVFLADESFELWDFQNEQPEDSGIRASLMKNAQPGLGANDPASISHRKHQRNFEEFVAAISEGREPATGGREARKAVALIEAIYKSARENGKRIFLE